MLDRLAASLNIAFKWFPMFDLDQTFSSNILLHVQMFDRLATSANKIIPSGKNSQTETESMRCRATITAHKALCGLTLVHVWSNIVCSFSHSGHVVCDKHDVGSFSRGFSLTVTYNLSKSCQYFKTVFPAQGNDSFSSLIDWLIKDYSASWWSVVLL